MLMIKIYNLKTQPNNNQKKQRATKKQPNNNQATTKQRINNNQPTTKQHRQEGRQLNWSPWMVPGIGLENLTKQQLESDEADEF